MASLNRWQGIGRLGKDPEVRNLDNGNTVANFSIACTESYKDKTTGDKKQTTEWINCVAWKGLADIAGRYLHKGDMIFLEGKLRTRTWEKDNVTRYIIEVVADNLIMLSTKPRNEPVIMESSGHVPPAPQAIPPMNYHFELPLKNIDFSAGNSQQNSGRNSSDDLPF